MIQTKQNLELFDKKKKTTTTTTTTTFNMLTISHISLAPLERFLQVKRLNDGKDLMTLSYKTLYLFNKILTFPYFKNNCSLTRNQVKSCSEHGRSHISSKDRFYPSNI